MKWSWFSDVSGDGEFARLEPGMLCWVQHSKITQGRSVGA